MIPGTRPPLLPLRRQLAHSSFSPVAASAHPFIEILSCRCMQTSRSITVEGVPHPLYGESLLA
jgi:hypothetical protein